jgi:hypothetical protein
MGMLHRCETDGCETLTLGNRCLEHEQLPPFEPAAPVLRAIDGSGARIALQRVSGYGDACCPGDPGFWMLLRGSIGFRVVTPYGRLGQVERLSARGAEPAALVVRTGFFRRRLIEIGCSEIEWIVPAGRRILLARAPDIAA